MRQDSRTGVRVHSGKARDPHRSLHGEAGARPGEYPGRSGNPLIKVAGLAWLEFEKPDLDRAERFGTDFGQRRGLARHPRAPQAQRRLFADVLQDCQRLGAGQDAAPRCRRSSPPTSPWVADITYVMTFSGWVYTQIGGSLGLAVLVAVFGTASRSTATHPAAGLSATAAAEHALVHGMSTAFGLAAIFDMVVLVIVVALLRMSAPRPVEASAAEVLEAEEATDTAL
jgi:hypothetical protein